MTTDDDSDDAEAHTDRSQPAPTDEDATAPTDAQDPEAGSDGDGGERDIVGYLEWGAVAGLGLVALVAVFRFYFAASRAIGIWISPDFEPVFQAAFNVIVLLFAATGIVFFVRRRR